MFTAPGGDAFNKSTRDNDEEQELRWDAIERLPTYDRLRKGILRQTLDDGKINYHEGFLEKIKIVPSKKRIVNILHYVNGIVRPSRMTLLLGPPGFGKTTLLKTFVGVLDKDLRVNGRISYCGRELSDFIPQKTCAYISQHDIHHGEITFRETLDFAGRCLGVGKRCDLLTELSRRE
ncbi:Pleiotropic drug resistance protein 1 [Capsicum baccatum]|uniref:Pleiotropic drug resistance protein 1 n=1 Tax=Capsicum baccatum TaxID=33114 RepID=A0A2G2WXS0_CAPBA|nr:Pleiotropic drug resistance protein 1 [Capsicum baccatum]